MSLSSTHLEYAPTFQDVSAEDTASAEMVITLHKLCASCTQFCEGWKVLDDFQHSSFNKDLTRLVYQLCTVTHMAAHEGSCHLCRFLYTSLQRTRKFKSGKCTHLTVYLRPRTPEDDKDLVVDAEVAHGPPVEVTAETFFMAFILKRYDCKFILPRAISDNRVYCLEQIRIWEVSTNTLPRVLSHHLAETTL
jgi:hypothetical protein